MPGAKISVGKLATYNSETDVWACSETQNGYWPFHEEKGFPISDMSRVNVLSHLSEKVREDFRNGMEHASGNPWD